MKYLAYSAIPDFTTPGCAEKCGGSSPFNALTTVSSRFLVSAITDPAVGFAPLSPKPGPPAAWIDAATKNEIPGLCGNGASALDVSGGKKVLVHQNWSNKDQKCV